MPRKPPDVEDLLAKAHDSQQRAAKFALQAQTKQLTQIIKKHPELVANLVSHANQLLSSSTSAAEPPPAAVAGVKSDASPPTNKEQLDLALARKVDRQSYKLELLPSKDLKLLLFMINRVVFTPWALKSLVKPGQRDASKSKLCELIEFCTGVEGRADLGSGFFETVGQLAGHLTRLNELRDKRGSLLQLPPDWSEQGVYKIDEITAERLVVRNQYSNVSAEVHLTEFSFQDPSKVAIDLNYSEERAVLKEQGTMNHKVLSIVFAGAKKSPLALLDGGLQTPTPKKRKVDNGAPSAPSGSNTTRSAEHLALEDGAAAEGLPKGGAADVEQLGAEHGANAGATSESDGEEGLSLSNSIPAEQTAGVEDAAVDEATFLPPGPTA